MQITLTEVKNILGISVATKDTWISALIPLVVELACQLLKTRFPGAISVSGEEIYFTASTKKITDGDAGFGDLVAGEEIYVSGSKLNDGFYTLTAAAAGELTVTETIKNENAGESITITNVVSPASLKLTLARIIGFFLQKAPVGLSDQTIGPLSWTYVNAGALPGNLVQELYSAVGRSGIGGF